MVQHHVGEPMCHMLRQWSALLNDAEVAKNNAEQDQLHGVSELPAPAPASTEAWSASKFELQSSDHGDLEVENKIADKEEDSDSKECMILQPSMHILQWMVITIFLGVSSFLNVRVQQFQTTTSGWSIPMAFITSCWSVVTAGMLMVPTWTFLQPNYFPPVLKESKHYLVCKC